MRTMELVAVDATMEGGELGFGYDTLTLKARDIEPGDDTTGWMMVYDGTEQFLCAPEVVEALLWVSRPHTDIDP